MCVFWKGPCQWFSIACAFFFFCQVDFDQLQDNLAQMERRCKASWDHLKVIAKHEMKPALKQKMSDFLKDCAERIIILKIVHRRIINRYVCAGRIAVNLLPLLLLLFSLYLCLWSFPAGFTPSYCSWAIRYTVSVTSASIASARSSVSLRWSTAQPESVCYSRNRRGPTIARGIRPEEKW